jgi:hypothetical protein
VSGSYRVTMATRGSGLAPMERWVLTCIAMRSGEDGTCWAAVSTLVEDTGLQERAVRDILRRLVALGPLERRERPGQTPVYRVHADRIPSDRPEEVKPSTTARRERNPGTRCTPGPGAPLHQVQDTPAPGGEGPLHQVQDTPAPGAPNTSRDTSTDPSKDTENVRALDLDPPLVEPRDDGAPEWARKARRPKGVTPLALLAAVARCVEAVRQKPASAEIPESTARPILGLWRDLGCPPLMPFVADVELVAEAARRCPDPMFARAIRGEGWAGKEDTSRKIASVCRRSPPPDSSGATWEDRIDAAREWDRRGRPTTGPPGRASPAGRGGEWVDTRTAEQRAEAERLGEEALRDF